MFGKRRGYGELTVAQFLTGITCRWCGAVGRLQHIGGHTVCSTCSPNHDVMLVIQGEATAEHLKRDQLDELLRTGHLSKDEHAAAVARLDCLPTAADVLRVDETK